LHGRRSILAAGVLALPNIGLYYGVQNWTARLTGGVVDARFIAVIDTTLESPLGQVAMIPLLTWIARNAPVDLKATFFAVMASFTNLALSASSLLTKYVNQIFLVTREVKDRATGAEVPADYSQLGWLLVTVTLVGVLAPLDDRFCRAEVAAQDPGLRQSCDPRARSLVERTLLLTKCLR
jgi:BT1 family